jgi:DNA-binding CsgD family transcriptional regulator/tetratricopeptide (TPR) repeat protein
MELVERQTLVDALERFAAEARAGQGRTVLLGGEAGVGKTTLVRWFLAGASPARRVLWGSCEPLVTPEPLAAFRDAHALRAMPAGKGRRLALLEGLMDELGSDPPTVMVLEDIHWADDATLDALRYLGRRVHATTGLLVATFREEDAPASPALRAVLGDLATAPGTRRLAVPPLTAAGVAQLAANAAIEPGRLHAVTGGNPFFVTEVLAAPGWTVPATVSDAVLARIARLDPEAGSLLEVISVSPGGLEPSIALATSGVSPEAADACVERGVLVVSDGRLAFRHELARLAVEAAVPATRERRLHAALLEQLEASIPLDPARTTHHAARAGDGAAVLRHAPVAAREAAVRGAHRAAADHLARAVVSAESIDRERMPGLLAALADERQLFDEPRSVLELRRRSLAAHRRAGDRLGEAHELLELARLNDALGEDASVPPLVRQATEILEGLPPSPELARAYAMRAYGTYMELRFGDALDQADSALALARRTGGRVAAQTALRVRGSILNLQGAGVEGMASYDELREMAEAAGDQEALMTAAMDAGADLVVVRRNVAAERWLQEAVDLGRAADLDRRVAAAEALQADAAFQLGRWDEAEAILRPLAEAAPDGDDLDTLVTRARIGVRRGTPGADGELERAWAMVASAPAAKQLDVAAGRAEAAWLAGRPAAVPDIVGTLYRDARAAGMAWPAGELALCLWRAGALSAPPSDVAPPFALQIAGDWRGAAEAWETIGCQYELAQALADGDEPAMRRALDILIRLRAEPAADRVRARMRRAGVSAVPGRPRASTRAAPAQLTLRQSEILGLLISGLSDREIAERLFITEKTAGHHVSAILAKLGVRSRLGAAAAGRKMGIVEP